jgi:hypothetical protein
MYMQRMDYFEELHHGQKFRTNQIVSEVIPTGVTLIEKTKAHFPIYLACRISTGRNALDAIPVKKVDVLYLVTTEPDRWTTTYEEVMRFRDVGNPPLFTSFRTYEESFWNGYKQLLSSIDHPSCIFIEVSDEGLFDSNRHLIPDLNLRAMLKDSAVVFVCTWKLQAGETLRNVRISGADPDSNLTLRVGRVDFPFSWDADVSDYRFDDFKGLDDIGSTFKYFKSLRFDEDEMLALGHFDEATMEKYS